MASTPKATLTVRAKPGSRVPGLVAVDGDGTIHLRLASPAREGKANAELLRLLADLLGMPAAAVSLKRGARSREKHVEVSGLSGEAALSRLRRAAAQGDAPGGLRGG